MLRKVSLQYLIYSFKHLILGGLSDSTILGNNNKFLYSLSEWLQPVSQSSSKWVLCWRASQNGWASTTFHSLCDYKGPTITIVRVGEYIFGGYVGMSWTTGKCIYYIILYGCDSKRALIG